VDGDVEPEEAATLEVFGGELGNLGRQCDIVLEAEPDTVADRLLAGCLGDQLLPVGDRSRASSESRLHATGIDPIPAGSLVIGLSKSSVPAVWVAMHAQSSPHASQTWVCWQGGRGLQLARQLDEVDDPSLGLREPAGDHRGHPVMNLAAVVVPDIDRPIRQRGKVRRALEAAAGQA
jgi:hypothetical protein